LDEVSSLHNFLQWCDGVGLELNHNKVYVSSEGTVADYGMLAKETSRKGRFCLPFPGRFCCIREHPRSPSALEQGKELLESSSGWVPLLLALLYEYTCPESTWAPYLSLWTDFSSLDQPLFWSTEERLSLLRGTGIPEAVERDLANIERSTARWCCPSSPNTLTCGTPAHTPAAVHTAVFQEPLEEEEDDDEEEEEKAPNLPMMVPMADMLNHVSNHNANLEYTPECLKMVCVRPSAKEVFNTYGQMANWQLLHMYGFTEPYPSNCNDTADIPLANLYTAATQGIQSDHDRQLVEEKRALILEMMGEKATFIFGKQGCLTDMELHTTLKLRVTSHDVRAAQ
ncbi:LOW QUALITY PROTEIN: hypothetical protein CRUP_008848, partial [Coryphaenoides rupestris]